jgi:predicted transcriptional regulator
MGRPKLSANVHNKEYKLEISIRISRALLKRLGRAVVDLNRSRTWIIEQALREYLDKQEIE